ncbi:MAG: hypothetical protein L3J21_03685 [Devosiaceae bacterium]|nr:hypothetical protein [Devosiaceae bacterium]
MSELSENQEELRKSIQKSSMIWALVSAVIVGAIAYWLLGGQEQIIRMVATLAIGGATGFLMFRQNFNSRAKSSKCTKCSAVFSISRTNREETLVSCEEKSEKEKLDEGGTRLTVWSEEKFDVVETYTCSSCQEISTKEFQITRTKDKVVTEKGAPKSKGPKKVDRKSDKNGIK